MLLRLGHLDEAEQWARSEAEQPDAWPETMHLLADVLERMGNASEADQWHQLANRDALRYSISGPVVIAAAVTLAVLPFVKALATKAGEDSYAAARRMVRWLFQRGRVKKVSEDHRHDKDGLLLVVEDPDPKLGLAIWLGTDTPDEQLRALAELDMETLVDQAKRSKDPGIHIQWDETSKSWKARHQKGE